MSSLLKKPGLTANFASGGPIKDEDKKLRGKKVRM